MNNLTLEEILTLAAIVKAQGINAQLDDARMAANSEQSQMSGSFYSTELEILESSVSWMYDAHKLWTSAKDAAGKDYAGLTLAEFVSQSRPK